MVDRSKMFHPQDSGEEASPERTIVGGRPPEQERLLTGLPTGIQMLLLAASLDTAFREKLLADPLGAAREAGLQLRPLEAAMLSAVSREQLRVMAERMYVSSPGRREFLMKSATAALAIVAGTVMPGCNLTPVSGGARPDIPSLVWETDLDATLGDAAETDRPVMAFFWHDPNYLWDGSPASRGIGADRPPLVAFWFEDQAVIRPLLSNGFLTARVLHPGDLEWSPGDADAYERALRIWEADLARFTVTPFPTILFLAPDASELNRLVQPEAESELLAAIQEAATRLAAWREHDIIEGIRPE